MTKPGVFLSNNCSRHRREGQPGSGFHVGGGPFFKYLAETFPCKKKRRSRAGGGERETMVKNREGEKCERKRRDARANETEMEIPRGRERKLRRREGARSEALG